MSDQFSRLDYCQYLLVSQINYTLTNFADHSERLSHDAVNRYLRGERTTPRLLWDNVRSQVALTERGYVIFDDPVLDKNYSHCIELVRSQYSGNAHALIRGISVVTVSMSIQRPTSSGSLTTASMIRRVTAKPNSTTSARCFRTLSIRSTCLFRPC